MFLGDTMGYRCNLGLRDLYDFRGFKVCDFFVTERAVRVRLERSGVTGVCLVCGKKRRRAEDGYERGLRDLDVSGRKATIYFRQYKIRCSCGYRGVERLEFVDKYSSCTVRFEEYVFMLCGLMSIKDVSKLTGMNWRAVKWIDKKYLAKIVFGKFHVAKKANEALDKVRKHVFASASKEEQKEMKHKRFLILKRNDKLDRKHSRN